MQHSEHPEHVCQGGRRILLSYGWRSLNSPLGPILGLIGMQCIQQQRHTLAATSLDARPDMLGEMLEAGIAGGTGVAAHRETLEELPNLVDDR